MTRTFRICMPVLLPAASCVSMCVSLHAAGPGAVTEQCTVPGAIRHKGPYPIHHRGSTNCPGRSFGRLSLTANNCHQVVPCVLVLDVFSCSPKPQAHHVITDIVVVRQDFNYLSSKLPSFCYSLPSFHAFLRLT